MLQKYECIVLKVYRKMLCRFTHFGKICKIKISTCINKCNKKISNKISDFMVAVLLLLNVVVNDFYNDFINVFDLPRKLNCSFLLSLTIKNLCKM